ncbi:hypothetical protein ACA910_015069 [Epithemia clementina (nom. ined.)]
MHAVSPFLSYYASPFLMIRQHHVAAPNVYNGFKNYHSGPLSSLSWRYASPSTGSAVKAMYKSNQLFVMAIHKEPYGRSSSASSSSWSPWICSSFASSAPIIGLGRMKPILKASRNSNNNEDDEPRRSPFSKAEPQPETTGDLKGAAEIEFRLSTASALVAGQSVVILLAMALTTWVSKAPGFLGMGENFSITSVEAWQYGVLAVVPLAVWAVALDLLEDSIPALQLVTKATQRSVLNLLGSRFLPITGLVVAIALGVAAGVGEEWLFRGFLQTQLLQFLLDHPNLLPGGGAAAAGDIFNVDPSSWLAVLASSLLFGILHAVTPLYAGLATLASLYFGCLYIWTDHNLAVPIICHAVYDIGALYYAHWTVAHDLTPQERRDLLEVPF